LVKALYKTGLCNGGVDIELRSFLTLALNIGEWLASRSGSFISGDGAPDIRRKGGWVGSRAGLDVFGEEKYIVPRRDSKLGLSNWH
jgi:hypothetical protein